MRIAGTSLRKAGSRGGSDETGRNGEMKGEGLGTVNCESIKEY